MLRSGYLDAFSIRLERGYQEEIRTGDLVRTGPNPFPRFEVVAVSGEKAWVRDLQDGADHLAPVAHLRKLPREALARAA
jgi:hypothetical protein